MPRPGLRPGEARAASSPICDSSVICQYLEDHHPEPSLYPADVSVASFFRNASFARFSMDAARWPKTASLVERSLARPSCRSLEPFETLMLRTPIARHRAALAEAGAPLTAETFGKAEPQRGVLST